jgi:hypothetical protein
MEEEEKKERCEEVKQKDETVAKWGGERVPFSLNSVIRSSSLNLAGESMSFLPLSLLLQFS